MSNRRRLHAVSAVAGYGLVTAIVCIALGYLASRITGAQLFGRAQQTLALVQSDQPLWQWQLRQSHDLIAGRAFGHATVKEQDGALSIASEDGTPFELGLPIAWALDLKHWPILVVQLRSSTPGTLGLVWQGNRSPACVVPNVSMFTPDTQMLRVDLRGLARKSECVPPQAAWMLRLRIQIPAKATVRVASVQLLTTEPMPRLQDVSVDLPHRATSADLGPIAASAAAHWPMPLFRLPPGIGAETMLALRDQLRARWPAALIVPAGTTPQAKPAPPAREVEWWMACLLYLIALVWLVLRPVKGRLRPWIEVAGCLLGPLWLVAGLHWGLRPTLLGVVAFTGGLVFALAIERRHIPRLWRWPAHSSDWLWPMAALPVTAWLALFYGHAPHWLRPTHVLAYVAWAWLQQWLMLLVLLPRLEHRLWRPAWAIVLVALIFALMHTPNGVLMQLCFVGELWWAWCFLRSRSVLPIALAHTACALLAESALAGGTLLRSLEVSARFFL